MSEYIKIPLDIYDSPVEMVIMLPLWWVDKSSVSLKVSWSHLTLSAVRKKPDLKSSLVAKTQECFRGPFAKDIVLPQNVAIDRIWSELSPENVLTIVVPKIVAPEEIVVQIR